MDKTISKGNNAFIICINSKSTDIEGKKKNITVVKSQFQPFQKLQEREGGS